MCDKCNGAGFLDILDFKEVRMKKRHIVLLSVLIAIILLVVIPVAVSAASGGDALAGLKEFYGFLSSLATLAFQGYTKFLESLG